VSVTILDGGMGRELQRIGAPFRQPEWSALALLEGPDWVLQAHQNFILAGADVITTNSYACVPFHIGEDLFVSDGYRLAALAGTLARAAADGDASSGRGVQVAGSLPPVFGSYRPDLFDLEHVGELLRVLVDALAPSVDHWLIETTGSIAEAQAALTAVSRVDWCPRWISFTLADELTASGLATLRSGESVAEAVQSCGADIAAMLFNCSPPEVMAAAVEEAAAQLELVGSTARIGVYANAFAAIDEDNGANETLHGIRGDLTPHRYTQFAREWVNLGASIVGGCCGIAPGHIRELAQSLS
jgi:S-methylmethionine-dependent homocysteine/selenocysteine methylase